MSPGVLVRLLVSGSTRTVGRLAARWSHRLGHLLVPRNRNSVASLLATGLPWAADNGAYSGFDPELFRGFLAKIRNQPRCLWLACPDVVRDAHATLERFHAWLPEVQGTGQPLAFVAQDGAEDTAIPWADFCCLFLAGSDSWRFSCAGTGLVSEARTRGKLVHMGRVNSLRRLRAAYDLGCDSVDGSSASRFGDRYVHAFCAWIDGLHRQPTLFGGIP
jgi:hypothetical protein